MTLVDSGQVYRRYEQDPGGRLGRHLWLDSRSLAYAMEGDLELMALRPRDRLWDRIVPIMDQGSLGACTGFAGTGALGTQPYYSAAGHRALPTPASGTPEEYAVNLYADATHADAWPGEYPPQDTGSSGLAICKVLKQRGTITGYRWAISARGLLRLLQDGPVLMGMPWYSSFFEPNGSGFIDARRWQTSGLAGGHEVEIVGCDIDENDLSQTVLTCANSWSRSWGDSGYFRLRLGTYERLRGVDLKQYVIDR